MKRRDKSFAHETREKARKEEGKSNFSRQERRTCQEKAFAVKRYKVFYLYFVCFVCFVGGFLALVVTLEKKKSFAHETREKARKEEGKSNFSWQEKASASKRYKVSYLYFVCFVCFVGRYFYVR